LYLGWVEFGIAVEGEKGWGCRGCGVKLGGKKGTVYSALLFSCGATRLGRVWRGRSGQPANGNRDDDLWFALHTLAASLVLAHTGYVRSLLPRERGQRAGPRAALPNPRGSRRFLMRFRRLVSHPVFVKFAMRVVAAFGRRPDEPWYLPYLFHVYSRGKRRPHRVLVCGGHESFCKSHGVQDYVWGTDAAVYCTHSQTQG